MKHLIPVFLLLFLSSPVYADDFQDGVDAYSRKNYKTAYEKWKPLAEQRHAKAQSNLGFMYHAGQGVAQDYKEAVKWYRLSAKQGHATAQYNVGFMYHAGQGVAQDHKKALRLFRLSAKQGFAHAQYNIGLMYYEGRGVIRDNVQAHKWFNIAGENGYKMGGHDRGLIEKFMTPGQIAEAQKLAREWVDRKGILTGKEVLDELDAIAATKGNKEVN